MDYRANYVLAGAWFVVAALNVSPGETAPWWLVVMLSVVLALKNLEIGSLRKRQDPR